jgi:transglutaminase-like putative cysteine protease
VQAVLDYLLPGQRLKYDGPLGSRHGVAQCLKLGYGRCWDFSDCFVTLCRASGVPARQVAGWLAGSEGHIWAEVLLEGAWRQYDPTAGMECGSDYIPYLTSADGELGLVYASAVQIEEIEAAAKPE